MARSTRVSRNAAEAGRRSQIASKKAAIQTLCACMHEDAPANNGRLPHGYMKEFVKINRKTWDWMSRDTMNAAYRRFKKKLEEKGTTKKGSEKPDDVIISVGAGIESTVSDLTGSNTSADDSNTCSSKRNIAERSLGGRPLGSTNDRKRREAEEVMKAKNEIAQRMMVAREKAKCNNKRVKNGFMSELIDEVKKKRKIEHHNIPIKTIKQRLHRKKIEIHHSPGHMSPLLPIEDTVIKIIIKLAEIRQCLTPSKGLALINSLISEQPIQKELVEWKKRYSNNEDGSVGKNYWRSFLKRNSHRIVSKRGQKYELDRQNWTTYANFVNMYDQCIDQMVRVGVAKKRDKAVWMDKSGNVVRDESHAFGCKVTHDLIHPDWCLVGDEVGGNISMKGDGHVGGRLYLTAKGKTASRKASKADRRFTLIGLTSLNGQPVMCIVIIQGAKENRAVEVGIDISVQPDGNPSDADFFLKNAGPGKYFPGGPVCHFRGKDVPTLI